MVLKAIYEKLEDIPEQYRDLFTERNGKFELTKIEGMKTTADVDRVQESLRKEREDHKKTKDKLSAFGDLNAEEVIEKLDRFGELEAASKDKLDDKKIEELAAARVAREKAPLERKLKQLEKDLGERETALNEFRSKDRLRTIHDAVNEAITEAKLRPSAREDALLLGERVFDVTEDGKVVTKDNVGVPPGLDPKGWLIEILPKREHWVEPSQGGGAGGARGKTIGLSNNPWAPDNFNVTEQAKFIKAHGREKAEQMAKQAGTTLTGGPAVKART